VDLSRVERAVNRPTLLVGEKYERLSTGILLVLIPSLALSGPMFPEEVCSIPLQDNITFRKVLAPARSPTQIGDDKGDVRHKSVMLF
jgi:hypothetical protein